MEHDDVEVWDFSVPDKPKRFRFNGPEVYEAPAVISPATMRALVAMRGKLSDAADPVERFNQMRDMFSKLLTDDSAQRFIDRFESRDDPIDVQRQMMPALNRLMEAYGLRPTQSSPPSATGGDTTGTTSTDGAQAEELTPSLFPPTGGSISATTGS